MPCPRSQPLLLFLSLPYTLAPFPYCSSPATHDPTRSIPFSLYSAIKSEVYPVKHSAHSSSLPTSSLCLSLSHLNSYSPLVLPSPSAFINPTKKCDQLHLLASARIDATRPDPIRALCSLPSRVPSALCPWHVFVQ